ncbi:MAG: flagellar protein FlgN [Acidaminococcales bacterium]|jgi:flagellar biosynthesis/type III secretory pathway chaperone|nr:flagellar protein FlgN [Acidaminococcales bacterium]
MDAAWEEMIGLLEGMSEYYLEMIGLAEEKRDALVNAQADKISKIIAQEEALIGQIGALENKRIGLVRRIAAESGWTDQKIKLLYLVERAPDKFAERMKQTGHKLADIVMRIAMLNGINNNLLKQAMHIVEYNINILSRAQAAPVYEAGGGHQRQDGKGDLRLGVLDRKA